MRFFRQLFGREDGKAPPASRLFTGGGSAPMQDSRAGPELATARRDLMRNVLRTSLARHGIPASWLGAEMLIATSRGRETGMHWRLLIKQWDPRLLTHAVALQNSLVTRLLSYDPLAADWLMGISWQFALDDESACPPLPQAGYWTADPRPAATTMPEQDAPASGADVIAGPVRIANPEAAPRKVDDEGDESPDSVRRDLDRLFAVRDAELKRHAEARGTDPTEPMYLKTEPQPLPESARREREQNR